MKQRLIHMQPGQCRRMAVTSSQCFREVGVGQRLRARPPRHVMIRGSLPLPK